MAVCYITQLEIYPSNPHLDNLDIRKVEDSVNLLEDLNYIRSVIRAMLGADASKWNDVTFTNTKNITELWKSLSSLSNKVGYPISNDPGTVNPPIVDPPVLPPIVEPSPLLAYSVNGMILTNKDPLLTDTFLPGEVLYTYVFNKRSILSEAVFGSVFAETPAKIVSGSSVSYPVSVDFSILDKNNSVIGTFSFVDTNQTTKVLKNPLISSMVFESGDTLRIIPNSSKFFNLENLSFYLEFKTTEYTSGDTQNLDLYAYVPNLLELKAKLVDDGFSAPYTILFHKNLNQFTINGVDAGSATMSVAPTSQLTLNIFKNTTQVGTIVFAANSRAGAVSLTGASTTFLPEDELIVKLPTTSLYSAKDLAVNFKTIYKNLSLKLQAGIHAYIPGNLPDEVTIVSYVSPQVNVINFIESKFILETIPTRVITLYLYKNATKIGYVTFEPGKPLGKVFVQDTTILTPGDCFYIKTGDNNPTGDEASVQNLKISILFNKSLEGLAIA